MLFRISWMSLFRTKTNKGLLMILWFSFVVIHLNNGFGIIMRQLSEYYFGDSGSIVQVGVGILSKVASVAVLSTIPLYILLKIREERRFIRFIFVWDLTKDKLL